MQGTGAAGRGNLGRDHSEAQGREERAQPLKDTEGECAEDDDMRRKKPVRSTVASCGAQDSVRARSAPGVQGVGAHVLGRRGCVWRLIQKFFWAENTGGGVRRDGSSSGIFIA